jgi:hypothetical protein
MRTLTGARGISEAQNNIIYTRRNFEFHVQVETYALRYHSATWWRTEAQLSHLLASALLAQDD